MTFADPAALRVEFRSKSWPLFVSREGDIYTLDFPSRPPVPCDKPVLLERALGVPVLETHIARDFVALVENEQAVRDLTPDFSLLKQVGGFGLAVTAKGEDCDFVSLLRAVRGYRRGPGDRLLALHAHPLLERAPWQDAHGGAAALQTRRAALRGGLRSAREDRRPGGVLPAGRNRGIALNRRRKFLVLNIALGIALVYQIAVLIMGSLEYRPTFNAYGFLYVIVFMLTGFYLLISCAPEEGIQWIRWSQKHGPVLEESDENSLKKIYLRYKWIYLALVLIASFVAFLLSTINIISNWSALLRHILSHAGISALLMLVLSAWLGIKYTLQRAYKPWLEHGPSFLLCEALLLHNFLVAVWILKMLCNAQV
jgi:hypothetical protein